MDGAPIPLSLAALPAWVANHNNLRDVLGFWLSSGVLLEADIHGRDVMDFGGGYGNLALLLLEKGARSVTVIDTGLDEAFFQEHLSTVPGLSFYKRSAEIHAAARNSFDLIVASSVTEHVLNLAEVLHALYGMLRPGGAFFTAHDNYFHPSGAHDNFMIQLQPSGAFGYVGPACWRHEDRCAVSDEFREGLAAKGPWAWDEATENARTPDDCTLCPLFRRARPWAHLIYADDWAGTFPQEFFSTGRPKSGLNKITPFQLRQFMTEAGLTPELWQRNLVANEPPAELLGEPHWHNRMDLKTVNVLARGRRRA